MRVKKETAEAILKVGQAIAKQMELGEIVEMRVCNQSEPSSCEVQCTGCELQTHHWLEAFQEDENGEVINPDKPIWTCKHCDHFVFYGEPESHPSGCDCPDCLPDSDGEDWMCVCGNYIEDGLHCECSAQPPWGCDCNLCNSDNPEDYDDPEQEFNWL